jgi:hypothetical protein
MGRQAVRIFDEAERLGGLRAKIALAVESRVSSTEATGAPDTPDLIGRLQSALARVRTMDTRPSPSSSSPPPPSPRGDQLGSLSPVPRAEAPSPRGTSAEEALRRHQRTFLDLMTQRSLLLGNVDTTVRRITEGAAAAIDVERVSVWRVDPGVTKITCADLYERTKQTHSSGTELFATDFGPYFAAMSLQRTIAAHDAHTDPRTSCFSESYLRPLGIGAMLDVPIWVGDAMVGVICHEHVGLSRTWTADEETFAYLMASFVSLAMEMARTPRG